MVLVVHLPTGENRRIEIREWRTVIGRSSKTDIKLVGKQISKVHAALEIEDGVPFIRDLNSRNGVTVNGTPITQPTQLVAGDLLTIGDAKLSIDPGSLIFRPPDARAELHRLLVREQQLRDEARQYESRQQQQQQQQQRPRVTAPLSELPRGGVFVAQPISNAAGDPPVLRVLRIADDFGPRNEIRIEAFLCELPSAQRIWIKPHVAVEVKSPESFSVARDVWIDEPEDFGGPGSRAMVIARSTYYLPPQIELSGCAPSARTPDGLDIYTEDGTRAAILIAPH